MDQERPSFVEKVKTDRGPGGEVNRYHSNGVQQVFQQVFIADRPTMRFSSTKLHKNPNDIHSLVKSYSEIQLIQFTDLPVEF